MNIGKAQQTTAMQDLIKEIVEHIYFDDDLTEDSRIILEKVRLRCLGKLELEKEQIIKAFSDGQETPINHPNIPSGNEYYSENYWNL